jgi:DNA mismatch repair ATPase MutS
MEKLKNNNYYFTHETEAAIVKYNNTSDPVLRDRIFTREIYYPFYKLVENIIHTFKFYYTDVSDIEDLKLEIISILVEEKIHRFDPSNGAKAFSYFQTIVKRWLINYNNKNYKKLKQVGSFDDMEDSYETGLDNENPQQITLTNLVSMYVDLMYETVEINFPKEQDQKVADAVLMLFKSRHDLEIFRKKALYIYIREMTDCETPTLTKVISKLKEEFYKLYNTYQEAGYTIQ